MYPMRRTEQNDSPPLTLPKCKMREMIKERKDAEPGSEKIITKQNRMRRRHSVDTWPCMIPRTETKHIYDRKEEQKREKVVTTSKWKGAHNLDPEKAKNSSWKKVKIKS